MESGEDHCVPRTRLGVGVLVGGVGEDATLSRDPPEPPRKPGIEAVGTELIDRDHDDETRTIGLRSDRARKQDAENDRSEERDRAASQRSGRACQSTALAASVAVAVELVAVAEDLEVIALRDVLLRRLDHLAFELDDLPAANADQVVVMIVRDLVAGDAAFEVPLVGEPCLAKELHRPVDGRVADARVRLADPLEEFLARHVADRLEKDLEDRLPLPGLLEALRLEVAVQGGVLDLVRHGSNLNDRAA
jgi:hypothetical protein